MSNLKVDTDLNRCLQRFTFDYNQGLFVPILESDVVGYLFHLWVSEMGTSAAVHLDTRLCARVNQKYDFVIGNVNKNMDKPCVDEPELVIEVKVFPVGMSGPQHRKHWMHVVEDDIPKLAKLTKPKGNRYQLLFDEADYLKGSYRAMNTSKIEYIKKVRDAEDSDIVILHLKKTHKLKMTIL